MVRTTALLLLLVLVVSPSWAQTVNMPACLGCICEASTSCNTTIGCSSHAGYHCGPLLLSEAFWVEAGSPTVAGGGGFVSCATDIGCAGDTAITYYEKFANDCDGDNQVSCIDYAMIHKLGGLSCAQPRPVPTSEYFTVLHHCMNNLGIN